MLFRIFALKQNQTTFDTGFEERFLFIHTSMRVRGVPLMRVFALFFWGGRVRGCARAAGRLIVGIIQQR